MDSFEYTIPAEKLTLVSNQKLEPICLPMALADAMTIKMNLSSEDNNVVISPQPLIDAFETDLAAKSPDYIQEFCTNIGLESLLTYPLSRVSKPFNERIYKLRGNRRYTFDKLTYVENKEDIKNSILQNFGPNGKKYPIVGAMIMGDFERNEYALDCYKRKKKPFLHEHEKYNIKDKKDVEHAVVILGCDTIPEDPENHSCLLKSTYKFDWGKGGTSRASFQAFRYIFLPGDKEEEEDEEEDEEDQEAAHDYETLANAHSTKVYVAIPMVSIQNFDHNALDKILKKLKEISVDGVMIKVCWKMVEKNPEIYDWSIYESIVKLVEANNLKIQMELCFHQVKEDDADIGLPEWVIEESKNEKLFFTNRNGNQNRECLSWGLDDGTEFLSWGLDDGTKALKGRSALMVYSDFMKAFKEKFNKSLQNESISSIGISLGPNGELRYPSYNEDHGWVYPDIGAFQCYDEHLLASLENFCTIHGHSDCNKVIDIEAYSQNENQDEDLFKTTKAIFFLVWYSDTLINHGVGVLSMARSIFSPPKEEKLVKLTAKLPFIYWRCKDKNRAAELTAGYYDIYFEVLKRLHELNVDLSFTVNRSYVKGMQQEDEYNIESLIDEVMQEVANTAIGDDDNGDSPMSVSGWNIASSGTSYSDVLDEALTNKKNILKSLWKHWLIQTEPSYSAFTYDGLKQLLDDTAAFKKFVQKMHGV